MKKYYVLEGKRNMLPKMTRLNNGRFVIEIETDNLLDEEPTEVTSKKEKRESLKTKTPVIKEAPVKPRVRDVK